MSHLPGVNVLTIIFSPRPVWGMLSDGLDEFILFFKKILLENNRKTYYMVITIIAEHGSTR